MQKGMSGLLLEPKPVSYLGDLPDRGLQKAPQCALKGHPYPRRPPPNDSGSRGT